MPFRAEPVGAKHFIIGSRDQVAGRDIIYDGISSHVIHCIRFADVVSLFANYDRQFQLPVWLFSSWRQNQIVIGARNCGHRLSEYVRFAVRDPIVHHLLSPLLKLFFAEPFWSDIGIYGHIDYVLSIVCARAEYLPGKIYSRVKLKIALIVPLGSINFFYQYVKCLESSGP
ncbi:hypothetical protein D3C76_994160 [compost metagenome]